MSDFFKDGSRWGSIDSSGSIYASDGTYLGSLDKFGSSMTAVALIWAV